MTIDIYNADMVVVDTREFEKAMKEKDNTIQTNDAFKKDDQVWSSILHRNRTNLLGGFKLRCGGIGAWTEVP